MAEARSRFLTLVAFGAAWYLVRELRKGIQVTQTPEAKIPSHFRYQQASKLSDYQADIAYVRRPNKTTWIAVSKSGVQYVGYGSQMPASIRRNTTLARYYRATADQGVSTF